MLTALRWFLLLALVAAIVFAGALDLGLLPERQTACGYNEATEQQECASYHISLVIAGQIAKVFKGQHEAISALATIAIAFLTLVLAISTVGLWRATREAFTDIERAFVSYTFHIHGLVQNQRILFWQISLVWANNGSTPTRGFFTHSSWDHFATELPADFTFPDVWVAGVSPQNVRSFIGPRGTVTSAPLLIASGVLDAARMGHVHVYIWGWAEYDDIFGGKPHRTEFCNKIICLDDPYQIPLSANAQPFFLQIIGRHSGADDELYRQPRPRNRRQIPLT